MILSQKERKIVLFSAGIKWAVGLFRIFGARQAGNTITVEKTIPVPKI